MNTADLCDKYWPNLSLCQTTFTAYGKQRAFHGPMATVHVFEDNVLVKEAIETVPAGSVLVIDGGGSDRCALVGGNLAAVAATRGLAGIIVYGCVRDVAELRETNLGILATGACPVKSRKAGAGDRDIELNFGGVKWNPGAFVYVDLDGVVISTDSLDM